MNRRRLLLFALVVIAFGIVIAAFVSSGNSPDSVNLGADIYYLQKDNSRLVAENHEIDGTTVEDMVNSVLEKMQEAPKNENLVSAIPENVKILGIDVDGKNITVNLSKYYLVLKPGQEMFCRAAIVWTLTALYFVDGVSIMVDDKPLLKTNGEPIGVMSRENLVLNAEIDAEPTNSTRTLVLYFSASDGTHLVKEERKIEVNSNESLEKYVIEALISGPQLEGDLPTVPIETKIRNIETADGICYVDLSQDFVTKHSGDAMAETLTVYSIVNSLCELSNIEKVQFLIEGEKQDEFKGSLEFSKPFEPVNYSIN